MNQRSQYENTKRRFVTNYKVAVELTVLPIAFGFNMLFCSRLEGAAQGLIVLPITLTLAPALLCVSTLGIAANTAWGLAALPLAAVRTARETRSREGDDNSGQIRCSTNKINSLLVNSSMTISIETSSSSSSLDEELERKSSDFSITLSSNSSQSVETVPPEFLPSCPHLHVEGYDSGIRNLP